MRLITEFKSFNQTCIKKLNELDAKVDSAILLDLKTAQKSFEDYQKANAFTKSNIEFLKNVFRKYQGLEIEKETGGIPNEAIVAGSYLGLVLLENMSENKNEVLIARYIFHMFEANPSFAKKCFPDIHHKFFQPVCDKICEAADQDLYLVEQYYHCISLTENDFINIRNLMEKYDVSTYISDWTECATSLPGKLAGGLANKVIGPVHISGANIIQIIGLIRTLSSPGGVTQELICFIAKMMILLLKTKIPKITEENISKQLKKTATEYLEAIDTEHIDSLSIPIELPKKE